ADEERQQDELNDVFLAHDLLLQLRDNLLSAGIQAIGKRDIVCRLEIHCALMKFHARPFRQVERPALTIPCRSDACATTGRPETCATSKVHVSTRSAQSSQSLFEDPPLVSLTSHALSVTTNVSCRR